MYDDRVGSGRIGGASVDQARRRRRRTGRSRHRPSRIDRIDIWTIEHLDRDAGVRAGDDLVVDRDRRQIRAEAEVVGADRTTLGDEQTGVSDSWTVTTDQSRSGSYSLVAPETADAGTAAWAVATGVDEPGVVFESWWWLTDTTAIDVAAGTRATSTPTDQLSAAGTGSPFAWELRHPTAGGDAVDASNSGSATTGAWVKVEMWTDQFGNSRLIVDGTEVVGWTAQGRRPHVGIGRSPRQRAPGRRGVAHRRPARPQTRDARAGRFAPHPRPRLIVPAISDGSRRDVHPLLTPYQPL